MATFGVMVSVNFAGRGVLIAGAAGTAAAAERATRVAVRTEDSVNCIVMEIGEAVEEEGVVVVVRLVPDNEGCERYIYPLVR